MLDSGLLSAMSTDTRRSDSPLHLVEQTWKVLVGLALFAGAIDLVNHLMVSAMGAEASFWHSFVKTIVWWISYVPLLACALLLANRYRLDGDRLRRHLAIHLLAAVGCAYVHTAGNAFLDVLSLSSGASFLPRLLRTVRTNFPIDFVSYWAIVGATYAFHYYSESHDRELAAERLKTEAAELEASLTEARLRALRAQLNPHFLFNTLNAISALALTGQPKAVARMLSRLSGLLRISLDDEGPQLTSLAKELEFVESYLEIQRLLCGDRLLIERNIAAETLSALVPTMILQPVIENAFVHGIARSSGPARLRIEAARDDELLRLTVNDSGGGFNPAASRGIGLANTEARLEQLYGPGARITYAKSPDGGASVTIRVPCVRALPAAVGV